MLETDFQLDKRSFSFDAQVDVAQERAYWLSKSPNERLEAMELMRQINYDYDPASDRVSRVLTVVERPSG